MSYGMRSLPLADFSGGVNYLDNIAANELAYAKNVRVDDYGRLEKSLGRTTDTTVASNISRVFYSQVLDQIVIQEGANLRKRTGVNTTVLIKTFSTADRVGLCDFNGKLIMAHRAEGIFSYDGAALSAQLGTVLADELAAWQNKVWAAKTQLGTATNRLSYCAPGDVTDWTGPGSGTVDIREVDDAPLRSLAVSPRVGLVVFKGTSTYRVTDSSNGAYVTIDPNIGAGPRIKSVNIWGNLSDASTEYVACINAQGIYVTDGASELRKVSGNLEPVFRTIVEGGGMVVMAFAHPNGRWFFSIFGYTWEWNPRTGAFMPFDTSRAGMALLPDTSTEGGGTLFGAKNSTVLFKEFTGGVSEGGVNIFSFAQLPWLGMGRDVARLQKVLLEGRGIVSVGVRRDELAALTSRSIDFGTGAGKTVAYKEIFPRKIGREFAIVLSDSAGTTTLRTKAPAAASGLSAPTTETAGSWGIHAINLDFTPVA